MDYIYVFIVLVLVLGLFVWGKIRHDFVALLALFALVIPGIIPAEKAFQGLGHPAVITVAAVLIIGKALEKSGIVDLLGKWVSSLSSNLTIQIFTLCSLVAVASAFMNNVGALAIVMPVAINIAVKNKRSPSLFLMPIAFASLLGGLMTLIGTPPNIIISTFREAQTGTPFGMFSFAPVGAILTLAGVVFVSLLGWRLLPGRVSGKSNEQAFNIDDYITEMIVKEDSLVKGKSIGEINSISKADIQILGLVRNNIRVHAPDEDEILQINDILIMEGDTSSFKEFMDDTGIKLADGKKFRKDAIGSDNISFVEAVVLADSPLVGQTSAGLKMRSRYGINLVAVSRKEEKIHRRLGKVIFRNGDVVVFQGREHLIRDTITSIGCLPLAKREVSFASEKKIFLSLAIFGISILAIVFGLLPVHVAFPLAAVVLILTKVLPIKDMYTSIDWPVIILLGAMLPVGEALETSGGAKLIADYILNIAGDLTPQITLSILIVVTMLLSGIINNAATVVLMAPIAMGIAHGMNYSPDPFLMTVAIGASASFLTPIGHQSNTLVMGPGGYRFGDYIRMGLPVSILVVLLAVPLILYFWPF
ncbi:MAG: potassium transporter TrkA [Bacteroidetes bacterium GWE2_39_28]|nr:MAG: potassium transporter TrkA [Bacteroidetes bacterium GWE2_39_28]OFY13242.1 MAG: potassium transporter TrkA [Bacteroidetes bacterium GWF2_39_10]OFZ08695.1 MAG: potassium transporter TrkA [Bacteroidetes bacterium RIFOXYB2_FULL_39_7]OFZ09590.1 MAG: potassium transporter TrkA [Bacteroidetes bacterium RIFOXYC2_FULL_39_11]HCT94308.1 SLC13 family permease [Rikenellaceae bacterium]